jgi:hypothetical protein
MVSPTDVVRRSPEYGLEGVHRLASYRQVYYAGSADKLLKHLTELGFSLDDVCQELLSLSVSDYDRSIQYGGKGSWHDVYLKDFPSDEEPSRRLYIKFRVSNDCVWLDLCSFHPEGWQ